MNLEELGYNDNLARYRVDNSLESFEVGRVITEHRERYIVKTVKGEYDAEITGNMRYTASGREGFPAVGDWVSLIIYEPNTAIINHIFPRSSIIKRSDISKPGEIQIIATNIDFALITQAVDRDFNLNRLERYLAICNEAGVKPVIIITKIDLVDDILINEFVESIISRVGDLPVFALSSVTKKGYDQLADFVKKGKTYCMLGSSGAGKSTMLNNLSGATLMRTGSISQSTSKGKHVTTHRELFILDNGAIIIDNPGMKEVGIADSQSGIEMTFDMISQLSSSCRYQDCTHTHEAGCAVTEAVEKGTLSRNAYENYVKMVKEMAYFRTSAAEKKKKDKTLGKILKNYVKNNPEKYT